MNDRMSSEMIAILGVGAMVLVGGVMILALGWNMYMYNSLNNRIDGLNSRIDQMQAENQRQHDATRNEMNRRFDTMQTENQRQHNATRDEVNQLRTEMNQLRTEMNQRFDTMQIENQRQYDAIQEVLRVSEGHITRLEEQTDTEPAE